MFLSGPERRFGRLWGQISLCLKESSGVSRSVLGGQMPAEKMLYIVNLCQVSLLVVFQMGACFSKVFDGCPLKINCATSWIHPDTKGKAL